MLKNKEAVRHSGARLYSQYFKSRGMWISVSSKTTWSTERTPSQPALQSESLLRERKRERYRDRDRQSSHLRTHLLQISSISLFGEKQF